MADDILGPAVQKELKRIQKDPDSHLTIDAGAKGAAVELEVEKGRWTVGAYARYYWDKTWEAAVRATRRW